MPLAGKDVGIVSGIALDHLDRYASVGRPCDFGNHRLYVRRQAERQTLCAGFFRTCLVV